MKTDKYKETICINPLHQCHLCATKICIIRVINFLYFIHFPIFINPQTDNFNMTIFLFNEIHCLFDLDYLFFLRARISGTIVMTDNCNAIRFMNVDWNFNSINNRMYLRGVFFFCKHLINSRFGYHINIFRVEPFLQI